MTQFGEGFDNKKETLLAEIWRQLITKIGLKKFLRLSLNSILL